MVVVAGRVAMWGSVVCAFVLVSEERVCVCVVCVEDRTKRVCVCDSL